MPRPGHAGAVQVAGVSAEPMEIRQPLKRQFGTALPYRVCVASGFAHAAPAIGVMTEAMNGDAWV